MIQFKRISISLCENPGGQSYLFVLRFRFPCALKYCRNKDTEGEHRCGIKTCKKCLTFRYPVQSREYCAWDEP